MAHNPLIDVAQAMMIDYFGLNEKTYMLVDIKMGNKNVPVTMDNGDIPVKATFPRSLVIIEHMKRDMSFDERVTEIRKLMKKHTMPEEWYDHFFDEIQTATKQDGDEVPDSEEIEMSPGEEKTIKQKPGKKTTIKLKK